MTNTSNSTVAGLGELGLVPILQVPIDSILPHPLNDSIYGPVSADDPDVARLAESIRKNGVMEPLVITIDNYILSGHRRRAGAVRAGLKEVPCRQVALRGDSPDVARILTEYNRQRVKRFDAIAVEEIIAADPEEATRAVRQYRAERAKIEGAGLYRIEGQMRRAEISDAKQPFLDAIVGVLNERREFWPLTIRQVHYALLNNPPRTHARKPGSVYQNSRSSYKALSELSTRARLDRAIPWNSLHDPTRDVQTWNVHTSVKPFIAEQLDDFLKDYWRDLQQSQPNHVEIVIEKATVENIIKPVASQYCIPLTPERGQCSLPPRRAMAERFKESGKVKLIVLILGDFDPDGDAIINAFCKSIRDDFSVQGLEAVHVALTHEQTQTLQLPPAMEAKETSVNYKRFADRYGTNTYELESVPPTQLQQILRSAIDGVIDVNAYNAELDAEKQDVIRLGEFRRHMKDAFAGVDLAAS